MRNILIALAISATITYAMDSPTTSTNEPWAGLDGDMSHPLLHYILYACNPPLSYPLLRPTGIKYTTRYSGASASRQITPEEKAACHGGLRGPSGRLCNAYAQPIELPTHLGFEGGETSGTSGGGSYGWLEDACFQAVDGTGKVEITRARGLALTLTLTLISGER